MKIQKQSKYSSTDNWVNDRGVHRILLSSKNEWTKNEWAHNNMEKSWNSYAEQNKPDQKKKKERE